MHALPLLPSAMATPPPYLDDAQIERLSALLEQRAVPFRGFNLEALDGFLSALVVSPSPVPSEEWEPLVWGGKAPNWGSAEEAQEVQALLAGHWNMCAARARKGEEALPDHLMPLMWLPEDPEDGAEALAEAELDVGREWALGCFEGVALREAEWDRWLDENGWIDEIFALLERLASGEVADADDRDVPVIVEAQDPTDVALELIDVVTDALLAELAEGREVLADLFGIELADVERIHAT